jgi:hypothetical protein
MNTSKFLAKVIGLYLLVLITAMILNMHHFSDAVMNLTNNAPLMLVTGCMTLILGLLMVVSHNIWHWDWRVLVTIVSWLVLLKGVSILYFPGYIDSLTMLYLQNAMFAHCANAIDIILGLILIYFGFKR